MPAAYYLNMMVPESFGPDINRSYDDFVKHELLYAHDYALDKADGASWGLASQAIANALPNAMEYVRSVLRNAKHYTPPEPFLESLPVYSRMDAGTLESASDFYHTSTCSETSLPIQHRPKKIAKITKPRVATTFWEDEGTTCYQVEAQGMVVSRREKDNYINGTKLLNVTGMTRGKRDGMLKSEKGRRVVRNGLMNLKGVWIPFHRAAEIARNEGVDDLLYPLFVKDIRLFFADKGMEMKQEAGCETKEEWF